MMSKQTSITKRDEVPARLISFIREQVARGPGRALLQQRQMGPSTPVDDWPVTAGTKAEELAELVWRRALDDAEGAGDGGLVKYAIVIARTDGSGAARWNFQSPPLTSADGGAVEGPDAHGAISLTMKHVREERAVSSHVFLEGLESLHNVHADQQVVWKSIVDAALGSAKAATEHLRLQLEASERMNERLLAQNATMQEKYLEVMVLIEEAQSGRHERDLAMEKMKRSEGRKTAIVDDVLIKRVLPALAVKFGGLSLGPGTTSPAAPAPGSPAAAGGAAVDGGGPLPDFSARQLRVIGAFLQVLQPAEINAIDGVLEGASKARFEELVRVFVEEAQAAAAAAEKANAASGATANGKGASAS